jgi:hypothetical protein
MNSNKLIAEFMGMTYGDPNDDSVMIQMTSQGNEVVPIITMKYHTSWDWLMPVIEKCFDNSEDGDMQYIMHHLMVVDFDNTYKAVIQFIKVNKIEVLISKLKSAYLDGETTQYILEQIGMDYQMYKQLNVKYNNNK